MRTNKLSMRPSKILTRGAMALLLVAFGGCPAGENGTPQNGEELVAGLNTEGGAGGNPGAGGSSPNNPPDNPNGGLSPLTKITALDVGVATMQEQAVVLMLGCECNLSEGLSYSIVTPPVTGTLGAIAANGGAATVEYTPAAGFSGAAQFSYQITHSSGASDVGTGLIAVYPRIRFALDIDESTLTVTGKAFTENGQSLPDGTYAWSFGGEIDAGPMGTHATRQHTFAAAGTYPVALAVTLLGLGAPVAGLHGPSGWATVAQVALAGSAPEPLTVAPAVGLSSAGAAGGPFSPTSIQYTLTNNGSQPLQWTAKRNATWLDLSSTGGTLAPGSSVPVAVSLNDQATGLAPGDYDDAVTFGDGPTGLPLNVRSVSLTVNPPGAALRVTPSQGLSPSGNLGGPFAPNSQPYTLTNIGGEPLNWTAENTQAWLSLSSAGGSLQPGGATVVTASLNTAANGLISGNFGDTILFTNVTNGIGSDARNVTLNIFPAPGALMITPAAALNASGTQGGPFTPNNIAYTLQNSGGVAINWTASKTKSWVTLSSTGGSLNPGATALVTATINSGANSLAVGNHSDTVSFTNTTNGSGNTTRAINLTVNATPGAMSVTPGGALNSSGTQGGPFSPSSTQYTVQNAGGTAINWTASKTKTWVSVSPANGSLNAGGSTVVTVTINSGANSLAVGNHSDTVTFTNSTNGTGNTTRAVNLTVNAAPGVLAVTPGGGLSSSGTLGGPFSPSNQQYTLQNTGGTAINWTASKTQSWVSLSATSGSLNPGASTNVTVTIGSGANSLNAGNHSDTVTFTNSTNGTGNTTRAVNLTVSPAGNCTTSNTSWQNQSFASQNGTFTAEFDAIPGGASIDGVTGLSLGAAGAYSDLATIVRFNTGGTIDVRNGSTYQAAVVVNYSAGTNYHFRMVVNVAAHTYSVYVTPQGGSEITLATNYAFRSEQASVGSLSNLAVIADPGSHQVCNFIIASGLSVTPGSGLSSTGNVGGPFSPSNQQYTLQNTGSSAINWTASKTQNWVTLSSTSGSLNAGGSAIVTASINSNANSLVAGNHNDTITFTNTTNGIGNTTRAVSLTVNTPVPGTLSVTPGGGLNASGSPGGPFSPSNQQYTLQNTGVTAINWTASKTQSWVTLSSTSGSLNPGATVLVTASINSGASSLAIGNYNDTVTFANTTNGNGNTTRGVALFVSAGQMASQISQYGITWTFDKPYPVGQYLTNDWWVVGPVTITNISPAPIVGANGRNGTSINPRVQNKQGYDARSDLQYDASLCKSPPFTALPGDSVVSTVSYAAKTNKTYIQSAAVLTIVDEPQPINCLRPPYTRPTRIAQSSADPLRYSGSQINWGLLPALPAVPSAPGLTSTAAKFSRPWVTHYTSWSGGETMPNENMPNYGREWADATGEASLQLLLDYPLAAKQPLLIGLVQLGIDLYGNLLDGATWECDAGIFHGRKWPILLAGVLLEVEQMKSLPYTSGSGASLRHIFAEDGHTYYFSDQSLPDYATLTGVAVSGGAPGAIACKNVKGAVDRANGGLGDTVLWRIREGENFGVNEMHEHLDPSQWSTNAELQLKSESYRRCCSSASYVGNALAARLMGAKVLWGHDAFFDYVDRWMSQDDSLFIQQVDLKFPGNGFSNFKQGTTGSAFVDQMWTAYR